jgi:hypothetical protein
MAVHAFQPGPLSASRRYELDGDGLAWRIGRRSGRIAFSDITSLRLQVAPPASPFHSACVVTDRSGQRHTISEAFKPKFFTEATKRTESFMVFTRALLTALPAANPAAVLTLGPSRSDWITAIIVLMVVAAVSLGGIALMLIQRQIAWAGLAFIGVLLALAPGFWPVAWSGGPRPLDAQAWLASQPVPA